jgi:ComEC/Rec2-related protein
LPTSCPCLTYLVIWRLLALVGWLAVRIDVRKPAALSALAAAFAYTVFTGSEAPAVRACVMAGVVFGAVLLDRRGVTRRSLALAALAILLVRPHSAVEPGFQMSFLATLALVSLWEGREGGGPTVLAMLRNPAGWVGASLLASFVAGAATAPVSGSVFHRVSPWGTVANLVATPVQDIVVAPFSLLAAVLSPLGWGDPFWAVARRWRGGSRSRLAATGAARCSHHLAVPVAHRPALAWRTGPAGRAGALGPVTARRRLDRSGRGGLPGPSPRYARQALLRARRPVRGHAPGR